MFLPIVFYACFSRLLIMKDINSEKNRIAQLTDIWKVQKGHSFGFELANLALD